jgi:hypothetical protein
MTQLQYTSRVQVDKQFFDKIDRFVDLMEKVDQSLPAGSSIRKDPTYTAMTAHRKINHFNVVTSSLPARLSNASDFSRTSIEARIQAGHDDAGAGDRCGQLARTAIRGDQRDLRGRPQVTVSVLYIPET